MKKLIGFKNNLKHYREKEYMTQRQLADLIGYSEKSISKWENGSGFPAISVLTELAEIFHTSLDSLIYSKPVRYYLLGIDGGGTSTVFKLTDENGALLKVVTKGASNPNDIGMDLALRVLEEGLCEICGDIAFSQIVLYAGISGGGLTGNNVQLIREFFESCGFAAFENGSDVENVIALVDDDPCIVVIMGTGFILYRIDGVNRKRIGGWGQLFDEGGSGYSIAKDGIASALRALEGSGKNTILTSMFSDRLGESVDDHLAEFYRGGKRYIARYSELVFQAAEKGDEVACDILDRNMQFVAQMIQAAEADFKDPIPVYFSGSISSCADVLFPRIQKQLSGDIRLSVLKDEPVEGAVKKAKILFDNMKNNA